MLVYKSSVSTIYIVLTKDFPPTILSFRLPLSPLSSLVRPFPVRERSGFPPLPTPAGTEPGMTPWRASSQPPKPGSRACSRRAQEGEPSGPQARQSQLPMASLGRSSEGSGDDDGEGEDGQAVPERGRSTSRGGGGFGASAAEDPHGFEEYYENNYEMPQPSRSKKNGGKNDDEAATSTGLRFNPPAKKKEDPPHSKPAPRSRKPPPSRD